MTENASREDHTKKVLFVCRANICRSPMAEAILNAQTEDEGLAYRAASAGVAALVGEEMAPNARAALEEVGIYTGEHRARQANEAMLGEADLLVLAMSPRQVAALRRSFRAPPDRVYTLPEYA
ncbi:MAG: hypothetical protein LC740_04960, partial [Actinobacteria bacterium]|nr:hypothetical protein [Actinomycetota bacterium]